MRAASCTMSPRCISFLALLPLQYLSIISREAFVFAACPLRSLAAHVGNAIVTVIYHLHFHVRRCLTVCGRAINLHRDLFCVRGTIERFHGILGQVPYRTVSNQDHGNATTEPEEWAFPCKLTLCCITLSACRYVG